MSDVDFLIVGQGLAGTILAWRLLERGASVLVVDEEQKVTSSKVAAGIINPITGKKLTKSADVDRFWPVAREFYRAVEKLAGTRFFHEIPVCRVLASEAEAVRWAERRSDPEYQAWFADPQPKPLCDPVFVPTPYGGFQTEGGGWLDTRAFLRASRELFLSRGAYRRASVDDEEVEFTPTGARWREVGARRVVFCQGHRAHPSRYFNWVPFRAAKGEILTIAFDAPDFPRDRILNRGTWLLPGTDGTTFRAGSTYSWHALDTVPTAEGRRRIEEGLRALTPLPFRVLDHEAAVRPIIRESRVLMGTHPDRPTLAFFNGLGSKGALVAPFHAEMLVRHLIDKAEVDPTADLRKNL